MSDTQGISIIWFVKLFICLIFILLYLIFCISIISFLIIYKRRQPSLSNREKLNYNLCISYLIFCVFFALGILSQSTNNFTIRTIGIYLLNIIVGDSMSIFFFYIFLFELALKGKQEEKRTLLFFIRNWSYVVVYPLFYYCYSNKLPIISEILALYLLVSLLWIPFKELYILYRICHEYKQIIANDEEEKMIHNKNYTRLVIFGIIQIITFALYVVIIILQIIKANDGNMTFLNLYPIFATIVEMLFIVIHLLFLFFFIYDEDSYKEFKRVMLCRKKEVSPEDFMVYSILSSENCNY